MAYEAGIRFEVEITRNINPLPNRHGI